MATDPKDQAELNKLYEDYIRLLRIADDLDSSAAKAKADTAKATGTLNKEIERLNKELSDTVYKSDYLYQSFRDTTAELKKQNAALQAGKAIFKGLTSISSDLNYFQQGITDLTESQIKKKGKLLEQNRSELVTLTKTLGTEQGIFKQQNLLNNLTRIGIDDLTASQKKLLGQLQQEKDLFEASKNALEEGLPALEQEYKISQQIFDVRKDLGGLATAAAGVVSKYGGSLSQFLKVDEAIESVKEYNQSLIDGALKSEEVIRKIQEIEKEKIDVLQNSLNIQKDIESINERIREAEIQSAKELELRTKEALLNSQIQNANAEEAISLRRDLSVVTEGIKKIEEERTKKIGSLQEQRQIKINELTQDELNTKLKLAELDKKEAKVKEDAVKNVESTTNKFKSLGLLIQNLGKGFKKALTDPLTIITFFLDKALDANKQAVELGKSLGYGADRANAFRERLVGIENSSSNINVNTANLVEAFNQLTEATGFAYEFTADQLETQIKLTKQVGLTANEAAQVQRFSVLTGKSSEQTYKNFVKGLNATANQLKVGINFKAALAEAVQVSGQLAANLGNNPERIAKAVVTAKAFGMTLDQVAKAGESLLNFETSIESELKAELLTGKQLNLERARAAALAGDQVTLAEELAKNVGSAADFSKMNVLQQRALAESVGMTADELANTLRKREEAIRSGKTMAQLTEEERIEALERQNVQDKFNAAMLKIQSIIGNIVAGPLGSFLDSLSSGLEYVTKIFGYFGKIFSLIKSIPGVGTMLGGIASIATIGALITLVTKSLTKGTILNPMVTKDVSAAGGLGGALGGGGADVTASRGGVFGRLKQAYKGGGIKGAGKSLSRMVKPGSLVKGAGKLLGKASVGGLLGGLALDYGAEKAAEAGNKNLAKGLGVGSGILGGAGTGAMIGSFIPGIGTAIGGIVGGAIGGLGALLSDNEETQEVEDGIASADRGPFKIKDKFGKTAITKIGDGLAVSPNINNTPALDLTPMISAINEVKAAVDRLYSKDTSINMDGKKVGSTLVQGSYKVA